MAIYLLDTSVIVDAMNGRRNRRELLADLLRHGNALACCTINVIEVYTGMRPHDEAATAEFLGSLGYHEVTLMTARSAGRLRYDWARKGQTLSLADATIAAVALAHGLMLMADNIRHFPMQELQLYPMSG
ncbi:MAG TPA: PIN domain-containing protein [Bryobacteraceae bacterium]|nr:PIN domain-containing protein [Bryobacteraceae bacterium]